MSVVVTVLHREVYQMVEKPLGVKRNFLEGLGLFKNKRYNERNGLGLPRDECRCDSMSRGIEFG